MGDKGLRSNDPVQVTVYRPSEDLQSYVTFFYFVKADGMLIDFLYPEWGNVRFVRNGSWSLSMPGFFPPNSHEGQLYGPTDRTCQIETNGGQIFGFGLTPIGWHYFFGSGVGEMVNRVVALGDRLGVSDAELHGWVINASDETDLVGRFERLLMTVGARRSPIKPAMLAVDRALRLRPPTIVEFARSSGLKKRTLQRTCVEFFGFAPKRLLRLQRFLDSLGQMRSAVGAPINQAIGLEYHDAPHFYHDFRDFMGMSPRKYLSAPRPLMAEAARAQTAAGVTLSFKLPPTTNLP